MSVETKLALRIAELEFEKARLEVRNEEYILRIQNLESQLKEEGDNQDVEG